MVLLSKLAIIKNSTFSSCKFASRFIAINSQVYKNSKLRMTSINKKVAIINAKLSSGQVSR